MSIRPRHSFQARALVMVAGCACCAPFALAQDSVSSATGVGGDAIDAYDTSRQTVRYAVDLVPLTTSWGNTWGVAPLVKTSRDSDALFNTLALGGVAVSPDVRTSVALGAGEQSFDVWSTAGAGVGPQNSAGGADSVSSLDFRYGVALSDLNAEATNIIGVLVGYNDSDPNRLYVRRTMAAQSRAFSFLSDNGTVTLGAIDADGTTHVRADDYNGAGSNQLLGQNIVRVNIQSRDGDLNGLTKSGSTNIAGDPAASTYVINNGPDTLNTPTALPDALATGPGLPLIFDFKSQYRAGSGTPTTTHLGAGVTGHRGNPTFSTVNALGGVGTVGSLARIGSITNGLNLFGVDASGAVQSVTSATLPSPMPGHADLNSSGDASFEHYNNQTNFRGPSGHVAVGEDASGNLMAAATATDPAAGDFIAVATFNGSPSWEVAARIGSPVLDGDAGTTIGTLADAPFGAISAPAMDFFGNVYFVGLFDDAINPVVPAVFKAVNTASGYQLELLLKEGQQFTGANSNTLYTVESLFLADSDSISSAGFSAASALQASTGLAVDASEADAVGGLILGATISYARVGGPEKYDVALALKPERPTGTTCAGDFDGDGDVDLGDFGTFGSAFGSSTGDANYSPAADFDGDGDVDLGDFGVFGGEFGRTDC
ncbi:MAG: hypothetical protein Tsb0013_15550 [Phycisphaerales bacterium]